MILIIACGNSLRSDDRAGLLLAHTLERRWQAQAVKVKRVAVHQLTPELAAEIALDEVKAVVFVDTRLDQPGETKPSVRIEAVSASASASLGHHLTPATLLSYTELLFYKQVSAWQVTVPGINFEHGESLSDIAVQALTEVDAEGLLQHIIYKKLF